MSCKEHWRSKYVMNMILPIFCQVSEISVEEQIQHQDNMPHSHLVHPAAAETSNINGFSMMPVYPMGAGSGISFPSGNPMEKLTLGQENFEFMGPIKVGRSIPVVPDPKATAVSDIALSSSSAFEPPALALGLSLSSDQRKTSPRHSGLHAMPCFNNGDSIISVA